MAIPDLLTGEPIKIVSIGTDMKMKLEQEAINRIFNDPQVKDMDVAIVSVAGAFRTGKSFLLNLMLRYLQDGDKSDMFSDSEPFRGFDWRGGTDRCTNGIIIWSKPIIFKGPQIALFLMDTEGTHEPGQAYSHSIHILSLSVLIASLQIFNVMKIINERHIEEIQYCTGFGKLALDNSAEGYPYQKLIFLIRDWNNEDEYPYGEKSGTSYLEEKVIKKINLKSESGMSVREDIKECFESLSCVLLPHPGLQVDKGLKSDVSQDFQREVKIFFDQIFLPEKIVPKTMYNFTVKGRKLPEILNQHVATLNDPKKAPTPENSYMMAVKFQNEECMNSLRLEFQEKMFKVLKNRSIVSVNLEENVEKLFKEMLERFDKTPKCGGKKYSEKYRKDLRKNLLKYIQENVIPEIKTRYENEVRSFNWKLRIAGGICVAGLITAAAAAIAAATAATAAAAAASIGVIGRRIIIRVGAGLGVASIVGSLGTYFTYLKGPTKPRIIAAIEATPESNLALLINETHSEGMTFSVKMPMKLKTM